jgi:hypothetical protein
MRNAEEIRMWASIRLIDDKVSPENRRFYLSLQTAISNLLYQTFYGLKPPEPPPTQVRLTLFGLKVKERPEIVSLETLPEPYNVLIEKLKFLGYQISLTFTEYNPVLVIEW